MALPVKQATDKGAFQWRDSPFVTSGPGEETDSVGEANPKEGDSQRISRPEFRTRDKGT